MMNYRLHDRNSLLNLWMDMELLLSGVEVYPVEWGALKDSLSYCIINHCINNQSSLGILFNSHKIDTIIEENKEAIEMIRLYTGEGMTVDEICTRFERVSIWSRMAHAPAVKYRVHPIKVFPPIILRRKRA